MSSGTLSAIVVYPLKSAAGIGLERAEVATHGFALDRRWMLVDETGGFLSQRQLPRMALLQTDITDERLVVRAAGMPPLALELQPSGGAPVEVRIWGDTCRAVAVDPSADVWFRSFLGVACRLVYMPPEGFRRVDPAFAAPDDLVGFADGFPFLLASESSLADLNARMAEDLPMDRFRPNLVVTGFEPYAEDDWRHIRIGRVGFRVVKPCARCSITTVNQSTAETGKEPLRALARFRRVGGKVMFGWNLLHDGSGTLRVGDPVEVEQREAHSSV